MVLRTALGLLAVAALIAAGPAEARGRRGGHHHHAGARVVVAPGFYPYGAPYAGYYPAYGPYDYYYAPYGPYAPYPYPAYMMAPAGTLVVVAPGTPSEDPEHLRKPVERGLP